MALSRVAKCALLFAQLTAKVPFAQLIEKRERREKVGEGGECVGCPDRTLGNLHKKVF